MFTILISNHLNTKNIINPKIGIVPLEHIKTEQIATKTITQKITYDPKQAETTFKKQKPLHPTIIETDIIDWREKTGRETLEQMLQLYHKNTNYSNQIGIVQNWPNSSKKLSLTEQDIENIVKTPYQQNRYGKPEILPKLQFLTAWTHPYTENWTEWEKTTSQLIQKLKQYHKPIYADTTITYHPSYNQPNPNNTITPDQLSWMIYRIYNMKYDGIIIRNQKPISQEIKESIINAANQINE